tara:strand:+ start:135 stop:401 length:267 start_codon:yes stop_codon:yes gene_type:complete
MNIKQLKILDRVFQNYLEYNDNDEEARDLYLEINAGIFISFLKDKQWWNSDQQRELLLAYERSQYETTWWLSEAEVTNRINDFLSNVS